MIINPILYQAGAKLPELENPGGAADLLAGKQLVDQYGNPLTGTMPQRSAANLTASGASVTVPAGYYPSQVSKSVSTATQATPSITVDSAGKITASATQSAGYVSAGTKTATKQLTTQAAKTVTPGTSEQTAVASGRYTTGAVKVAGDANLIASNIKSGVSIFGVTGTLASAGDRIICHIKNETSWSINVYAAGLDLAYEGVAAGQEISFPTKPNSPVEVQAEYVKKEEGTYYYAAGSGSTNCELLYDHRVYLPTAYDGKGYKVAVFAFSSAGVLKVVRG